MKKNQQEDDINRIANYMLLALGAPVINPGFSLEQAKSIARSFYKNAPTRQAVADAALAQAKIILENRQQKKQQRKSNGGK